MVDLKKVFKKNELSMVVLGLALSVLLVGCSGTVENDEEYTEEIAVETTEESEEESEEESVEMIEAEEEGSGSGFSSFTATTTNGEEVTEEVFAAYDITMVNIWATWCSPCVSEMDELQEVYVSMPENVNLISICYDGKSETDLANEILSENGVEFLAIIPDDSLEEHVIRTLQYFPTTIFVDSEGNIIGDYIEGAPSSDAVGTYQAAIDEYMDLAGIQ